MGLSLMEGFAKSLAMTVLSEIGDNTFFAAAIMAMRHPRSLVLLGCVVSMTVMTSLSALLGWFAPNLLSPQLAHRIATILFFIFGLLSLWEGFTGVEEDELAEAEAKLDADSKAAASGRNRGGSKDGGDGADAKKQQRPFLRHLFSPVFLKAFSITFFGEWGDRSQIATIGLAADENPLGVVLGGIVGQTLCTIVAVVGGKSLASHISERMVTISSGVLFVVFGVHSFLSSAED